MGLEDNRKLRASTRDRFLVSITKRRYGVVFLLNLQNPICYGFVNGFCFLKVLRVVVCGLPGQLTWFPSSPLKIRVSDRDTNFIASSLISCEATKFATSWITATANHNGGQQVRSHVLQSRRHEVCCCPVDFPRLAVPFDRLIEIHHTNKFLIQDVVVHRRHSYRTAASEEGSKF